MLVIGLTGGIGSGKSVVADLFACKGVTIIDADVITRKLVEPGQPALAEISRQFGETIIKSDGSLDRKALSDIAFGDSKSRQLLEAILHPRVRRVMAKEVAAASSSYVILVIPLLVESGKNDMVDRILVVDCDEAHQIQRTTDRDNRTIDEVRHIMKAQATRPQRLASADDVIENNSNLVDLKCHIDKLHQQYSEKF